MKSKFCVLKWVFPLVVLVCGCTGARTTGSLTAVDSAVVCAEGFTLVPRGDVTLLSVRNPWQGAQNTEYRYALCPRNAVLPDSLEGYTIIRTPVERVICLSTTHVAMLSAIGEAGSIKALSGAIFVCDTAVRSAIARGEIIDIGYETALDYERIVALKPDVVFAYGVGQEVQEPLTKLGQLGVQVVLNAEYLEKTVIAKLEWLKFMAAFYHKIAEATELFDCVHAEYDSLAAMAAHCATRPSVMCDLPWNGVWYIPGGQTTTAALIADAGGDYLWRDNSAHQSVPISIEAIIDKGAQADFWINTGMARSLTEIRAVDERLSHARPWKTGAVFSNYTRVNAAGGNDFFESGIVQPHIILKDLIKIFHPELLPNHQLYYYHRLNN